MISTRLMKRTAAIVLLAAATRAWCDAPDWQMIYTQAKATVDRADDETVSARMIAAAKAEPTADAQFEWLCNHAADLVEHDDKGYPQGIEAMQLLASRIPDRATAAMQRAVDLAEYEYKRTLSQQRAQAGSLMVTSMMQLADAYAAQDQWDNAQAYYQAVAGYAQDLGSADSPQIKQKLAQIELHRKIAGLKQQYAANRSDTALAAKLMRLYLVEMDDPHTAWSYWLDVDDKDLKHHADLAQRTLSMLSPADAMDLGKWYAKATDDASDPMKPVMQRHAAACMRQVLKSHIADADQQAAAKQLLAGLNVPDEATPDTAVADKPQPDPAAPASPDAGADDPWNHLLARLKTQPVDVQQWSYADGVLTIDARAADAATPKPTPTEVTLEKQAELNYDCVLNLSYDDNHGSIGIIVPVRDRGLKMTLIGDDAADSAADLARQLDLKPNKRYTVRLSVVTVGDKFDLSIHLDAGHSVRVEGDQARLAKIDRAASFGIYAQNARVKLYRADFKPLSNAEAADRFESEHAGAGSGSGGDGVIKFFGVPAGSGR